MLPAGVRWEVSDDWDFGAAGRSHRSEAGETWGYIRGGCCSGRRSAEADCCRLELVGLAHNGVWEEEVCFGRRREERCRCSAEDWRLLLAENEAGWFVLADRLVLEYVAVAARKRSEQPRRRWPVSECHR